MEEGRVVIPVPLRFRNIRDGNGKKKKVHAEFSQEDNCLEEVKMLSLGIP